MSQGVAVGAHCPVVIVRPEHAHDDEGEEAAPIEPLAPPPTH